MEGEGFTETDFILELELYDIVRPPTWQSWNATAQIAPRNTASVAPARAATPKNTTKPALDPTKGFWANLTTYLLSQYDADDVEDMMDIINADLDSKMENMSLDELERIAASLVPQGP